jgi:DNA polymerase (family 10)
VISTDAHSVEGMDVMRFGVQEARRGGLTRSDVLNTLTAGQFLKRLDID